MLRNIIEEMSANPNAQSDDTASFGRGSLVSFRALARSLGNAGAVCLWGDQGKTLRPKPAPVSLTIELPLDELKGPIGLDGVHDLAADGSGEQVGELEPAAVGLLVREGRLEEHPLATIVAALTDPLEFLSQLLILFRAPKKTGPKGREN